MSRAEAGWAARAAARRCGVSGASRRARSSCRCARGSSMCARGVLGTGRCAHMLCCGPRDPKLAIFGPNGAALIAAPCGRPPQRARPARPRRACTPTLRTRAPHKRPTRTKGALQPTSQHVRTPITVPRTPQACSSILHDHRPDARAHKTPVQRPHPRAAMRATRSPRARHTQNVQRLPGALQQQVLLVLEHLHVEKSGLRRRGREHRHEQVRRRRRARTSRSAGSARPAISRVQRAASSRAVSNFVTRTTCHVPKPATFYTHTDHTLLLTPTDYSIYHHIVLSPDGFGRLSGFGRPFSLGWPTSLQHSNCTTRQ